MINSALFTYRRRVQVNGEDVLNDNYINPLNVISFYWQQDEEGKKVLSVFLANNYTITFVESVGKRFVDHMEDFLRFMLGAGGARTTQNTQHEKKARKPISAEVVEEEIPNQPDSQWVQN